jgi:2-oxoglutarate ferredoxin oxidoreductase subunit beta
MDRKHMQQMFRRAHDHRGSAFVEIYQNCNVFNDGAFMEFADKAVRADRVLFLEHGKPMIFGKNGDRGIRLNGMQPEIVQLGSGVTESDLLVHDETRTDPALAFILSRMHWPEFPEPLGVFRDIERPTYDALMEEQIAEARQKLGEGDLAALLAEGDTWTVE